MSAVLKKNKDQDLTYILNDIDKKDVPPEMWLLWEEQRKILNTVFFSLCANAQNQFDTVF